MALSNHLTNIYKKHIHPNLIDDEFIYSKLVDETINDVWINVKPVEINGNVYYIKDDIVWFFLNVIKTPRIGNQYAYLYYDDKLFNILLSVELSISNDFNNLLFCVLEYKIPNLDWTFLSSLQQFESKQIIYNDYIKDNK